MLATVSRRPARLVPPLARLVAVCATLSIAADPAVQDAAQAIVRLAAPGLVTPLPPREGDLSSLYAAVLEETVALTPYGVGQAWLTEEIGPLSARLLTTMDRAIRLGAVAS
jgi:hypothetical protein